MLLSFEKDSAKIINKVCGSFRFKMTTSGK